MPDLLVHFDVVAATAHEVSGLADLNALTAVISPVGGESGSTSVADAATTAHHLRQRLQSLIVEDLTGLKRQLDGVVTELSKADAELAGPGS